MIGWLVLGCCVVFTLWYLFGKGEAIIGDWLERLNR